MVPGPDGYSDCFYKYFEDKLVQLLKNTMKSILQGGQLPKSAKKPLISKKRTRFDFNKGLQVDLIIE